MARNLEATPAAMAANYKAAYEQFGWSRHGDMPGAVQDAIRHSAETQLTPEQAYTDAMTDKFLAAVEAGDRDGMRAVAKTFAESDVGKQVQADVLREITEAQRALPGRDHPLFVQAMQHLEDLGPETARYRDDAGMERIAGAIAFEAKRRHMAASMPLRPAKTANRSRPGRIPAIRSSITRRRSIRHWLAPSRWIGAFSSCPRKPRSRLSKSYSASRP